MSSINESGENEFAFEESNIVGISENSPDEKYKKILKSIKKEISQKKRIRKNNTLHFFVRTLNLRFKEEQVHHYFQA
jgi:hypothetical protein